jgi:hypothetical protein
MSGYAKVPTTAADGSSKAILFAAGDHCKGEFRCADCGYGVTICRDLPPCPMCGCESWRSVSWAPMTHAQQGATLL